MTDPVNPPAWRAQQQYTFTFELVDAISGISAGHVTPARDQVPTLSHDATRTVKRQVQGLVFTRADAAVIDPVGHRLRIALASGAGTWPLGTYAFADYNTSPTMAGSTSAATLADLMWVLDVPMEHAFSALSVPPDVFGEPVDRAVARLLAGRAVSLHADGTSYKSIASWQPGTSRAKALEELASDGAYWPPWFTHEGLLRLRTVFAPDDVFPTFDWDTYQVVFRDSVAESDSVLTAPNRIVVTSNGDGQSDVRSAPVFGAYDVPDAAPHSAARRGFVVAEQVDAQVTSSAQAKQMARALATLRRPYRQVELSTLPDPRHESYDVVRWDGANWLEVAWSMPLAAGAEMRHTLQRVYE